VCLHVRWSHSATTSSFLACCRVLQGATVQQQKLSIYTYYFLLTFVYFYIYMIGRLFRNMEGNANCLNACSTPNYAVSGPYPAETIYYMTGVPLGAPWNTCKFLFIQ
jgi:hypothetical protein